MPSAEPRPIACDSCGLPASPLHIADRLARLQLATRYRPVHISTLLICTAPPARLEDDLYAWERQAASTESRSYLASLLACTGIAAEKSPAEQLAEFQRLGFYLARLVECPLQSSAKQADLAQRFGPTLLKRIQLSYKPRRIALLDPAAPGLVDVLIAAGLRDSLANAGQGIVIPENAADSAAIAHARTCLATGPAQ